MPGAASRIGNKNVTLGEHGVKTLVNYVQIYLRSIQAKLTSEVTATG